MYAVIGYLITYFIGYYEGQRSRDSTINKLNNRIEALEKTLDAYKKAIEN